VRAVVLLLAALAAAAPAFADDITIKQAIAQLQAKRQFVIDNHIANMQLRAKNDPEVATALATGELQARSKVFIGDMHDKVIDLLRAQDKPGATVSSQEVDNYVQAFRDELFALRDAMVQQVHEKAHSPDPKAVSWDKILADSRDKREEIVDKNQHSPVDHPGPVRLSNAVIETLRPDAPKSPAAPPAPATGGGVSPTAPAGGAGGANGPTPPDASAAPGAAPSGVAPKSPEQSADDRLALGDVSGAKSDLNDAAKSGTASADAYALRGELAMNEGRFASAVQDASSALQLDPKNPNALAVLHNSEGRSDGAPPSQAASGSGSAPAAASVGGVGGGSADGGGPAAGASASAAAAAASVLPSSSALSRLSAGQARSMAESALGMNDLAAARAYVDRALTQEPNNPALLNLRAQISARRGDYAGAKADAMAGLALAPLDPGLRRTLGFAQVRSKDYRDAIATANGMMERDPSDAYAYALRAHAYGSMGDRDAMMADLKRAAELDPSFRAAAAKMEGQLELPKDSDVLFLFPGEPAPGAASAAPPAGATGGRGVLLGAGAAGVLLLAGALFAARKRPEPEPELRNDA